MGVVYYHEVDSSIGLGGNIYQNTLINPRAAFPGSLWAS